LRSERFKQYTVKRNTAVLRRIGNTARMLAARRAASLACAVSTRSTSTASTLRADVAYCADLVR
jgi:hypothetical protein